ncbi:MAG: aldo/keto reductase [Chloroflexota bacterium]
MNDKVFAQLGKNGRMPLIGFGTYLISNEDVTPLVSQAIHAGYRHIDTAEGYDNEAGVGTAVQATMNELNLHREELFVTTKLWPGNAAWGQTPRNYGTTIEALDQSLARLQLAYVDLYLIHAPVSQAERLDQWRGLVELQQQGKAKAIGVSNYSIDHIEEIKAAGLPLPQANQIELHPWSQKPELTAYLANHAITAIAYSSLVPLSTWRIAAGQDSAKTEAMKADGASQDSPFKQMAQKYGISEAQLLLRWGVQKGYPVLPKSSNPERVKKNIDLFSFTINDADMKLIATMDRGDGVAWSIGDPTKFA